MVQTGSDKAKIESLLTGLYRHTGADRFFEPPQVGIAAAGDPFFTRFKEIIGEFHWTPQQALSRKYPEAVARSVIVWVLPVSGEARRTNASEQQLPSVPWAEMRSFGELANEEMRTQMVLLLNKMGYPTCAPHLDQNEIYPGVGWDTANFTSSWSERHAAFVAGLGTFGLSASLITAHGTAMRLGSVVTALELPADPRPYGDDPFAWCTRCGACVRRCPAGAVGREFADRDKPACAKYAYQAISADRERYGWEERALGCGLCQTGVPCEHARPAGAMR